MADGTLGVLRSRARVTMLLGIFAGFGWLAPYASAQPATGASFAGGTIPASAPASKSERNKLISPSNVGVATDSAQGQASGHSGTSVSPPGAQGEGNRAEKSQEPQPPKSSDGSAAAPTATAATTKLVLHPQDSKEYECVFIELRGESVAHSKKGFCPDPPVRKTLAPEIGDVVVVVKAVDYYPAQEAMSGQEPVLSMNGISMAGSARLEGTEATATQVKLKFRVTQVATKESLAFWRSMFELTGFVALHPIHVTLGWKDFPNYFRPETPGEETDSLSVTSPTRLVVALVLGLALVGGFVWALWGSDIFRIGPALAIGKRQAFSFSRVQWGLWMTFAMTAAVFLWTILGTFPGLSKPVLELAGVSTLAATTSFFMDSSNPMKPEPSNGFLNDLLSGSGDTTAQAHRFQALAVNAVLLVGATYDVIQHLGYPDFDATWVAMLGLSNAGQLVGKQLLENKNPPVTARSGDVSATQ